MYQDSIITFTDETVDQSRPMISERWPSLFGNILPTDFILRKINSGVVISIRNTTANAFPGILWNAR
ncbi:hypothetical protein RhiirA5_430431 [Rhizophagus irregularis]|uniref:Uncharacterized protein n=1 Tax=Rhizophagus irregularis TaxID=588596 RepID=A0A2N1MMS3_9GLOM|nr:hypothetical protein RhiirA5_430431 [Rhizophagus irregularis]PKK62906.1 hypothetical protein RhiirC2_855369 [Rhizophagus irregularis]